MIIRTIVAPIQRVGNLVFPHIESTRRLRAATSKLKISWIRAWRAHQPRCLGITEYDIVRLIPEEGLVI